MGYDIRIDFLNTNSKELFNEIKKDFLDPIIAMLVEHVLVQYWSKIWV